MPLTRATLILLALLTLAPPLAAREPTEAERAAVAGRFAALSAAAAAQDFAAMADLLPPALLRRMAAQSGMTEAEARLRLIDYLATLAPARIVDFAADLPAARWQETEAGEPVALVPTVTRYDVAGEGLRRMASRMVALLDGGQWYLVDIGNPMNPPALRATYPGLPDLSGPAAEWLP